MIISVEQLRSFVETSVSDAELEAKLQALELLIRKKTNNNFQNRGYRRNADIIDGIFVVDALTPFVEGDTVQISNSTYSNGIYTVNEVTDNTFTVDKKLLDESNVLVTKVEYPMDVVMGVVDIMKWKLKNEAANSGDTSKKDIQSETISRHSVTYVQDATESDIDEEYGVPKKHLSFLKAYHKARF